MDGFIADDNGGYAWISGQDDKSLDTNAQYEFSDFLNRMDIVVVRKRSFEQGFHAEGGYAKKVIYVTTHEKRHNKCVSTCGFKSPNKNSHIYNYQTAQKSSSPASPDLYATGGEHYAREIPDGFSHNPFPPKNNVAVYKLTRPHIKANFLLWNIKSLPFCFCLSYTKNAPPTKLESSINILLKLSRTVLMAYSAVV